MNINHLFLDEKELDRLALFKALAQRRGDKCTILELGEQLYLSYGQVYRQLKIIIKELKQLEANSPTLSIQKGYLKIEANFPQVDIYRAFLAKQSVPYCFLKALLAQNFDQVSEFFEAYQLSKSTFYGKTKALRQFAKENGLQISMHAFDIRGDEFAVRQFFFCLLWLMTKGADHDIYSKGDLIFTESEWLESQNYLLSSQVYYWLAIINARVDAGHYYKPKRGLALALQNYDYFNISAKPGARVSVELLDNETQFLRLYAKMHSFFLNSLGIPSPCLKGVNLPEDHVVYLAGQLITHLLHRAKLISYYDSQSSRYEETITYLCFVQYFVPQGFLSVASFYESPPEKNTNCQAMQDFLSDYEAKLRDYLGAFDLAFFSRRLASFLSQDEKNYSKKLRVGLSLEVTDPMVKQLVSNLLAMKDVDLEWFSPQESYDYVVHSLPGFEDRYPEQASFYWQHHYDQDDIKNLQQVIYAMTRQ